MSIAYGHAQATFPSRAISNLQSTLQSDDPVALGLRESARRMIGIAVFSGVINILMLSGSLYMLQVYDRVIPSRNTRDLARPLADGAVRLSRAGIFRRAALRACCAGSRRLFDAGLQEAIHTALATLPLRGVKPMLMQQPLRDLDQVRGFMSSMGPTAFLDMPWIPIFLIALFLFHPAIGMTALLGTAAIIAMTLLTERMSRGAAKAAMDSSAQRQVLADATQRNAEVIRALGMTDRFTARWSQANERYLRENIRATDVYANLGSSAKVLRYVLQSGMLGIGAYLVVADKASGGIMIASSIMMGRALAPVEIALGTWKQLVAARQGITRLREICKATAPPAAPPVVLPRPCRELSVQNSPSPHRVGQVRSSRIFRFRSRPAWDWHCLAPAHRARRRSPRRWSESGRPRMASCGSTAPRSINGETKISAAISAICRRTWPCSTAPLPKTSAVSTRPPPSDAILKAAQIAGVHDIILRLPEGYSTRIGEGGMSLSAGQRQRIGLARAVFGDPFLIVLDEPNANLDADGENALTRAIQILRHNKCIVIVISHRPSALAALNMAMVLYDGKSIAFGPCEEIFARVRTATGQSTAAREPAVAREPAAARQPAAASSRSRRT